MAYFSSFLSVFTFQFIQEYLGPIGLYLVLGISSLIVVELTQCFMPETRGRTEKEIAQFYTCNKNREDKFVS